jgi:hypothetical protein
MHLDRRIVSRTGNEIVLTPTVFDMSQTMMQHLCCVFALEQRWYGLIRVYDLREFERF